MNVPPPGLEVALSRKKTTINDDQLKMWIVLLKINTGCNGDAHASIVVIWNRIYYEKGRNK